MPKFTAVPLLPCDSSQLKEFGYDAPSQTLAVRFHGKSGEKTVYTYTGVPEAVHDRMRAADADPEQSVGKFFGEHIKGKEKFPFTKFVETDEEQAPA